MRPGQDVKTWLGLAIRSTTYAVLLLLGLGSSARAAMSCSILSTSGVSFGSYDSFRTTPVDSAGFVSYRCTNVAAGETIMIQLSRGSSSSFLPRTMQHRESRLEYQLFLDASRTIVWGDGTTGTSTYQAHPVAGQSTTVPIFGRIAPRQNVRADTYTDLVIVTVLY